MESEMKNHHPVVAVKDIEPLDVSKRPLISCLCVTEARTEFMPWVLWCFNRQTWPEKELVIIDSSYKPFQDLIHDKCRIISVPPGTGIAAKRNLAMQEAHGEIITWFDDDDWQHPDKLTWIANALDGQAVYAGACSSWFLNLNKLVCVPYRTHDNVIIFNSSGFRKTAVRPFKFSEKLVRASDTLWMNEIFSQYSSKQVILDKDAMFFWLCHDKNISNSAEKRCFPDQLNILKRTVGSLAWGDTDKELKNLKKRLLLIDNTIQEISGSKYKTHIVKKKSGQNSGNSEKEAHVTPVSLMIKTTVLDAPFLNVMVRHMISQARYPFTEKTIIVDRNPGPISEYGTGSQPDIEMFNTVLEQLLSDAVVDRIMEVDTSRVVVLQIMTKYFEKDAFNIPLYSINGYPIYSTLYGLESMPSDYVLQMDADIFFHVGKKSWVAQALDCMEKDTNLWLMMTHPAPPAGPPGKSLGPLNFKRAQWDREFKIWRFPNATTRYFLCNRRKLHHRLIARFIGKSCIPLEQIISNALRNHCAYRGVLGDLNSWHIHAWYHGAPFPQKASLLAKSIEAGKYPIMQRGEYDLRLDREKDRYEWLRILNSVHTDQLPKSTVAAGTIPDITGAEPYTDQIKEMPGDNGSNPLSIAVVIPVRNRKGKSIRNTLKSLNWQSAGKPLQTLVVSYGSKPKINSELKQLCMKFNARLICVGDPAQPWSKPIALNIGIRESLPAAQFLMTVDADIILAPDLFSVIIDKFKKTLHTFILCRSSDLPSETSLSANSELSKNDYYELKSITKLRPKYGTGGIQAAQRSFFFDVRGYDEDLLWWGGMDTDMMQRALCSGLKVEWIEELTSILHQWHPRKHSILNNAEEVEQAKKSWVSNHEIIQSRVKNPIRNPDGWGRTEECANENEYFPQKIIRVLITTYNRPKSLIHLLKKLNESAGAMILENRFSWQIFIDIWNDGGQEVDITGFSNLICSYYREKINHGKRGYWKLINKAYNNLKDRQFDFFIQLPDDVEVKKTFFREAVNQWSIISDSRKISLNLLLDKSRIGCPNWTNFIPIIKSFEGNLFFLTGWNDLCFIADKRFLEAIKYCISPIPEERWCKDHTLSSGVGHQISRKLYQKGFHMYQARESIIYHGDQQSRMNPEIRQQNPLISCKLDKIHCSIASYPTRINSLKQAVESIIDQVDSLHIYLNNYKYIPDFLKSDKINVYLSDEQSGDLGDAGKFFKTNEIKGYYLSIDDDLIYPAGYVWRILNKINDYGRSAVIGVHGKIMKPSVNSYYKDKAVFYHCTSELQNDQIVHVLGTGTMGFHTDTIKITVDDFKIPNMADIWMAIIGQKRNIPFISISRKKNWLKHVRLEDEEDTIYNKSVGRDKKQTEIFNSVPIWILNHNKCTGYAGENNKVILFQANQ